MTQRRPVTDRQQGLDLSLELGGRDVTNGKDASKAGDETTPGYEPTNRARADPRLNQLPSRHPAALKSSDLSDPLLH